MCASGWFFLKARSWYHNMNLIYNNNTNNGTKIKTQINVQEGLDFIPQNISSPQFPRNIMTQRLGGQVLVLNKQKAMNYFRESDFLDCRISAYP